MTSTWPGRASTLPDRLQAAHAVDLDGVVARLALARRGRRRRRTTRRGRGSACAARAATRARRPRGAGTARRGAGAGGRRRRSRRGARGRASRRGRAARRRRVPMAWGSSSRRSASEAKLVRAVDVMQGSTRAAPDSCGPAHRAATRRRRTGGARHPAPSATRWPPRRSAALRMPARFLWPRSYARTSPMRSSSASASTARAPRRR